MSRIITDHSTNPANERIRIEVVDEPDAGGANHRYLVTEQPGVNNFLGELKFQNGAIGEVGINGITQEILLAVCIDRLRSFQAGKFACRENAIALTKIQEALMWLQARTRAREARGVEGTQQV
jgi:hypothetical protein